jgi:TatD DNase family protein
MFIDSHCHLEGPKFAADRAEVVSRAYEAGIRHMLAIGNGNSPEEADCGIRVAEEFDPINPNGAPFEPAPDVVPFKPASDGAPLKPSSGLSGVVDVGGSKRPRIYASVGIHPHEAKLATDANLAQLEQWSRNPRVIAWGEIGLDYWYDFSPRDVQRRVFLTQLELARAAKKPIIIHCRPSKDSWDAMDGCLQILAEHWASSGLGGIMHCFPGTMHHAKKALALGFLISFAGNVSFPKAENIREAAQQVPLDQILIETDSPYLAPIPHRGQRNEPAYVVDVARHIAELRGVSADEIGIQTTRNFLRFFHLT